jgi:hypothetical protein
MIIHRALMVATLGIVVGMGCYSSEPEEGSVEGSDFEPPASAEDLATAEQALVEAPSGGFPAATCRAGFTQRGARMCISALQNARTYQNATLQCRGIRSHVCTYADLAYVYDQTAADAAYNPDGRWIGNIVADDQVLCGNRTINMNNDPDEPNFEGTCNKNNVRAYWCCHDDD